ncbi:MAG: methyltransferase domain-containing protein [Betaproteobacteria bacterium]|nr:methyltransferase domain-containing protein [Betaproteobacteria bacterium]
MFVEKRLARFAQHLMTTAPVPMRLQLWNGLAYDLGPAPAVTVKVKKPSAVRALVGADFSELGEAFIHELIDVEGSILEAMRAADALVHGARPHAATWTRLRRVMGHSRKQDARAIEHHYDVSNEFYRLWLDRNMTYSCGYFRSDDDSLDAAQEQKFEHICRKLMLAPGERLLDIGCGWGGLILHAARHHGARALGITLSRNQFEFVRERIAREGLADRCSVELLDYRDVPENEKFDKIASVGMFEHVGLANLPVYFRKIERLLADDGLVMNHGITTMDPKSRAVGLGAGAFIDRYIFPHGELPHLSLAIRAMSEQNLEAVDVESLRYHYARTLDSWASRLESAQAKARDLVGEQRYRTWLVYLAGCAHAFSSGWISLHQILAAKADRKTMKPLLWTREHQYLTKLRAASGAGST